MLNRDTPPTFMEEPLILTMVSIIIRNGGVVELWSQDKGKLGFVDKISKCRDTIRGGVKIPNEFYSIEYIGAESWYTDYRGERVKYAPMRAEVLTQRTLEKLTVKKVGENLHRITTPSF